MIGSVFLSRLRGGGGGVGGEGKAAGQGGRGGGEDGREGCAVAGVGGGGGGVAGTPDGTTNAETADVVEGQVSKSASTYHCTGPAGSATVNLSADVVPMTLAPWSSIEAQHLYDFAFGTCDQAKRTRFPSPLAPSTGDWFRGRRLLHAPAGIVNVPCCDSVAGQPEKNATTHHSYEPSGSCRVRSVSSVSDRRVGAPPS